jgi:quinol-cytochrome oxidoreductase complex cytochrome b subunit
LSILNVAFIIIIIIMHFEGLSAVPVPNPQGEVVPSTFLQASVVAPF